MSYFENAMKLKAAMNIAAAALDDDTAVKAKALYPRWESGLSLSAGERRLYSDRLYRCIQAHTSQADWTPDISPALWTVIDESHAGTVDDPIPYNGNMELTEGLYYEQEAVLWLCIRSSGAAVYAPLSELDGLYVQPAASEGG